MGKKCLYPGCTSGLPIKKELIACGFKKPTFFSIPKDPRRQKVWQEALHRVNSFTGNEYICDKHFHKDDISCQYKVLLNDGSTFIMDKKKTRLSSKAIPLMHNRETDEDITVRCNINNVQLMTDSFDDADMQPTTLVANCFNEPSHTQKPEPELSYEQEFELADPSHTQESESSYKQEFELSNSSHIQEPEQWNILEQIANITLPEKWTYMIMNNNVIIGMWTMNVFCAKCLILKPDSVIQVLINNQHVDVPGITAVNSFEDLLRNIEILQPLILCNGRTIEQRSPNQCLGFVDSSKVNLHYGKYWCANCSNIKYCENRKRKCPTLLQKYTLKKKIIKVEKQRKKRMQLKTEQLKKTIKCLHTKCSIVREDYLNEKIKMLLLEQQKNVRMCFKAASKSKKDIRYSKQWIYECLLMRIKSPKLYDHLRSHNILPLPHVDTLHKYLQGTQSAYGFNKMIFQCLKEKAKQLPSCERRGSLLIDEMKLSQGFRFNRKTHQFEGFVNLGDYTPEHQKNEPGDHALVLMFQPFRGKWVQVLACFLSKGCAASNVLSCIILECITYLEDAGFFCDVVTTDGAQWNRSMWTRFGITEKNISCEHPCDPERRLWFCSDFPHLMKNFRNWIIAHSEIWTLDGIIRLKHWRALLDLEHVTAFALKISYKLSVDHLAPKYYQKMNVALAFEFFSRRLAVAMTLLKSNHPDLVDCEPTVNFITRVDILISIMTSRTCGEALIFNSEKYEHIQKFIEFLNEWEIEARKRNLKYLTDNTSLGLKITLRATLEIVDFVSSKCDYQYLMIARLNQDALERFFGLARGVCGSNDHPDAILFGHMFRLMSTYSLIKPCKGSNVSGGEMLSTLLTQNNIRKKASENDEFLCLLDSIIENGDISNADLPVEVSDKKELQETTQYIMAYMAGYIVHKAQKWTTCPACLNSLESTYDANIEANKLIKMLTIRSLKYPSQSLQNMVTEIEKVILTIVHDNESVQADTLFHVCYALQEMQLPLVGCYVHNKELSKRLLNFYLIMRANFISKTKSKRIILKEKTKKTRKDAKL